MGGRTHGKDTATVLAEIKKYHPNLLFDNFEYKNCHTKVSIGCKEHGYFEKYPNDMKNGKGGCPQCNKSFHKTHEHFLKEVNSLFPHLEVCGQYQNAKTKILFNCITHNYAFETTPNQLLSSHVQCPECIVEKSISTKLTNSQSVVDPALKTEYERYRQAVWRFSNRSYKKYMSDQKRDRHNHLDHVLSIVEGFKHNVPPEVMGSIHNLRILDGQMNRSKSYRSEISVLELLERYSKNA
jgi:hypothetical protein